MEEPLRGVCFNRFLASLYSVFKLLAVTCPLHYCRGSEENNSPSVLRANLRILVEMAKWRCL